MTKRIEAAIYGRVQGVYFRETTRQVAQKLQLTGWVANQADGSVFVVAEGSEDALNHLLIFLYQGPSAARVDRITNTWQMATGEFHSFTVRWI